jgi:hypothetical protein
MAEWDGLTTSLTGAYIFADMVSGITQVGFRLPFIVPAEDPCLTSDCAGLEQALTGAGLLESVTCTDADGGCSCDARRTDTRPVNSMQGAYSTADGTLQFAGRTFHYCVEGDTLTMKEYGCDDCQHWASQTLHRFLPNE